MTANQKPLNQIGIFWYQFTPRKLLYLTISVNLIKFGPHWLSVFLGGHPVLRLANLITVLLQGPGSD